MAATPHTITLAGLLFAFLPTLLVLWLLYKWTSEAPESLYGLVRMLGQLLVIGYFLTFIFESNSLLVVLGVLALMVLVSSWISLRTVKLARRALYTDALLAILVGGGVPLLISTALVLGLSPLFTAQYMIPLAGMAFAAAMNGIGISAERYQSERAAGHPYKAARSVAYRAAMIPIMNSLFAVGLVSLPGMMTGQILSGVDPLIAARYQIMVMCMLFSSTGLAVACFLYLLKRRQ